MTYFFTVNLADRQSDLLVRQIAALREVTQIVKRANPFVIVARVVLPRLSHKNFTCLSIDSKVETESANASLIA